MSCAPCHAMQQARPHDYDGPNGESARRRTSSEASDVTAFGYGNCKEAKTRRRHGANVPLGLLRSIATNLDSFRHHAELTDLTLVAQQRKIHVHRCILAAASPYFRCMYSSGMSESRRNEVELKDVNFPDLKLVVDFVYTSEPPVLHRDNAADILRIADLFLIQELKVLCVDYMSKNMITLRDVIPTFALAEAHCLEALQNHAADFISTNMSTLLGSDEFLEADAADVAAIFRSEQIVFFEEDSAFSALRRWILHRPDERLQLLEDLLPCVRLTLISSEFLVNDVLNDRIIAESDCAWDLVKATVSLRLCEGSVEGRQAATERIKGCRLGAKMSLSPRRGPSVQCSIVLGKEAMASGAKALCYVPVDNRWINFAEAPFRVEVTPSTIYFKGGLFVLGGELGKRVFRLSLDGETPIWREIGSLNQTRATGCCVLYHKNELYVIGGSSSKRKKRSRQRATIEKYDEVADRWVLCDPLPSPCYRCDVVHLASDDILLRTQEFSRATEGNKPQDRIHYYCGSTITKMREEKDIRVVEEYTRAAVQPPEQLDINCVSTLSGNVYEVSYGQRKDVTLPPFSMESFTICNALVTRRAIVSCTAVEPVAIVGPGVGLVGAGLGGGVGLLGGGGGGGVGLVVGGVGGVVGPGIVGGGVGVVGGGVGGVVVAGGVGGGSGVAV